MACKIIYKGISYDEFDFKSQIERYVTINNLFNENESLANAVYESLGFEQVYHGSKTTEKYSEYKIPVNKGVDSLGSFFTSDLDGALMFTPDFIDESPIAKDLKERTGKVTYKKDRSYVKKEYLKLQNPYSVDIRKWEDNSWINDFVKGDFSIYNFNEVPLEIVDRVKKILIDRGHDGIYIAKDFYVGNIESRYDQYIVFDPNKTLKQQKQQTQQLYSEYLDTIFPDSKVKDIVYHGTNKDFDDFSLDYFGTATDNGFAGKATYVTPLLEDANGYGSIIKTLIVNVQNSFERQVGNKNAGAEEFFNRNTGKNPYLRALELLEETKEKISTEQYNEQLDKINKNIELYNTIGNYDSVILKDKDDILEIAVLPEQIHILGSKQDIEGFKQFVSQNNQEENPEETLNLAEQKNHCKL